MKRGLHHPAATAKIGAAVKTIRAMPECWPAIGHNIHRVLLRRFPFGL